MVSSCLIGGESVFIIGLKALSFPWMEFTWLQFSRLLSYLGYDCHLVCLWFWYVSGCFHNYPNTWCRSVLVHGSVIFLYRVPACVVLFFEFSLYILSWFSFLISLVLFIYTVFNIITWVYFGLLLYLFCSFQSEASGVVWCLFQLNWEM